MDNIIEVIKTICICTIVVHFLLNTRREHKAIQLCKECLIVLNNKALTNKFTNLIRIRLYNAMVKGYLLINDHLSAIECCRKLMVVLQRCGKRAEEGDIALKLAALYQLQSNYKEAKCFAEKALSITIEIGARKEELAYYYVTLGTVCQSLGEYAKAQEYGQKALNIMIETSNRIGQGLCYLHLGAVLQCLSEYVKAKEYLQKALNIMIKTSDRKMQGLCYQNLGVVFQCLSEYVKAEEYLQKALNIMIEYGERKAQGICYGSLGVVFSYVGAYSKAEEYLQKALVISKEIGDRQGEAKRYGNLGFVALSLGAYSKAEEHLRKALVIKKEIGHDRQGQANDYLNLAAVFEHRGEYAKAEECLQEALLITKETGHKKGESTCYGNLGGVFLSLGKYAKAEEYIQKAVLIKNQIGDRNGAALDYGNLGNLFCFLGEYATAKKYLKKTLTITKEIGDRRGQGTCYGNLASVFKYLGENAEVEKNVEKALVISKEIGDRPGEANCYRIMGELFAESLDQYAKAEEYLQKALALSNEIGDKKGQTGYYGRLGNLFQYHGEYVKAKECHKKAITICKEIGAKRMEIDNQLSLACDLIMEENTSEAFWNLFACILKSEDMVTSLRDNEQFKISLLDSQFIFPYRMLSALLCKTGYRNEALTIIELGRARVLADLMLARYSVENQMPLHPQSRVVDFKRIMEKESGCACLYTSYLNQEILLWVLKGNKPTFVRRVDVNDCLCNNGSVIRYVNDVFSNDPFRGYHAVHQDTCDDRSLFPSVVIRPVQKPTDESQQPKPTLSQCYKMLVAPVADLLDEPELIIVPDRVFYEVPFAALIDDGGKYLSENFRVRIVPSLKTLKLIQDSPADYHSQTGALIVGDPKVSQVSYKGCITTLLPLPAAKKEAEMIARLLGTQPLLGEHATKQTFKTFKTAFVRRARNQANIQNIQSIHSVSLIHFAAHGDADRGEIALAPLHPANGTPQEEDYLLTMADISQVRLRAKLVVLSCCHSARGQIRSEGVVGIARAFLGSGARSVLVALWALDDTATEQFMARFYEHLVCGESASESLHETMKWMRSNGFSDVGEWAPFMLIGDNVTFHFGN